LAQCCSGVKRRENQKNQTESKEPKTFQITHLKMTQKTGKRNKEYKKQIRHVKRMTWREVGYRMETECDHVLLELW
jgi:hypothetical protein